MSDLQIIVGTVLFSLFCLLGDPTLIIFHGSNLEQRLSVSHLFTIILPISLP